MVATSGGAFLFSEVGGEPIPTPEALTSEQRQFYVTARRFTEEQVLARANEIEKKDNSLLRILLRQAGELGLLAVDIPPAFGGLGLDKTTSMLIAEAAGVLGSWSVTFSSHTGIGTLPIVWFGSAAQKARYLPGLATGELVPSYALTEQGSGSDALGAKTRAVLSPDGKHYVLNGSKLYITNAAFADLFIVFAKVNGEKFSAFIVNRKTPGFSVGPEEHKMGIRGSSTCPLYFEDARIPVESLLGEVGKGHKIAFNILNLGRLKLGVGVLGGMKFQLQNAVRFAGDRRQFGKPILHFPLIREKLCRMASAIYAVESMAYRTTGLIDRALAVGNVDPDGSEMAARTVAAIEEFAIESSILKVAGSEANGQVVDDAVQIHGGAGFIEEYAPERAYRDARINRIFEGTNEINRLLICTMLLKRSTRSGFPPISLESLHEAPHSGTGRAGGLLAEEAVLAGLLKRVGVAALQKVAEVFGTQLDEHQEATAAVADILIDAYALDSMVARARQAPAGKAEVHGAMVRSYAIEARPRCLNRARKALCAATQGAARDRSLLALAALERFVSYEPAALRETVVGAVEAASGYPLPIE